MLSRVSGRGHILIVDDDTLLLSALTRAALDAGLTAVSLLDGSQTLEVSMAEQFDLILLDVNMPATDGRDILRELKNHSETRHIPVCIHSARDSHHDRISALELGACDYFEKPFELDLLFRRIVRTIEKTRNGE